MGDKRCEMSLGEYGHGEKYTVIMANCLKLENVTS
jgi:hypothetical protein